MGSNVLVLSSVRLDLLDVCVDFASDFISVLFILIFFVFVILFIFVVRQTNKFENECEDEYKSNSVRDASASRAKKIHVITNFIEYKTEQHYEWYYEQYYARFDCARFDGR
jgi:hypothetical protein